MVMDLFTFQTGGPVTRQSSLGLHGGGGGGGGVGGFSTALDGLEMIPDYHAADLTRQYLVRTKWDSLKNKCGEFYCLDEIFL